MKTRKVINSGLLLAVGLMLPFLTGQIPQLGQMLTPMHFPVIICGLICGWQWGLCIGIIMPLFRSMLFGMPVFFPSALAMAFELAVYGAVSGILYVKLGRTKRALYISLITAMAAGRCVWGTVMYFLLQISGTAFTFHMFLTASLAASVPGIILQIILIPRIVMAIKRRNNAA